MKRESRNAIRALAALVLLALTLSACIAATPSQGAAGGSPEAGDRPAAGMANVVYDQLPDMDGAELVAVTGNDYIPLNFIDPASGQAVGWEYDAVNEICRRLNCVVNWQVTAWEAMIQAVADEQFDVGMDGITITAERAQIVDFSDPYMTSQQFMLVRAGEDRFDSPGAFAADEELLVGAQAGTTGFYTAVYDILDGDEANPRIRLLDSFGASVQALIAGDVDLVLVDAASGRGYIGANPEKLKIVGDALATEEFGFIFTQGSTWTQPFNAAIASMKADGYLDHLNTRWFFLTDPNADDIYDQLPDMDGAELVAVTGNDYIPLNFIDPASGQAVGWEYDAVNEICRRLNCVVNWQVTAWEAMIQAVADEQFDVGMDGITITAERAQIVDFSDPYMTSQQFMLVRAGEDRFDSPGAFADDEGLLVGAQAGTTGFLHRCLRHPRRRRGQPAHPPARQLRRLRPGTHRRRRRPRPRRRRLRPRLHRRQPRKTQDRRRRTCHRRVRLHLHPGQHVDPTLQRRHRQHESRRIRPVPERKVVLPVRPKLIRLRARRDWMRPAHDQAAPLSRPARSLRPARQQARHPPLHVAARFYR